MLETRRGVGILMIVYRTHYSGFMDIIRGTKNECQVSIQCNIKVFDQLLTN